MEFETTPEQDKELFKVVSEVLGRTTKQLKGSSVQIFAFTTFGKNKEEIQNAQTSLSCAMAEGALETTLLSLATRHEWFKTVLMKTAAKIALADLLENHEKEI